MADYDVGALALTTPPAQAVITSYRPAVSVRNNGIHDALASGTLRIYKAGLLVFTTEIYSGVIAPGETKPAQATDYWTPDSVGTYQFIAYVSCPLDQYEPNNSLAPTLVNVTSAPPPAPPPIGLHASQHEDGGADEINLDGLPGKLAEEQDPTDHATNHQLHGPDQIDIAGLPGVLADPQTPTAHGNERHTTLFVTPAGLAAHNANLTAHEARRGVAGGLASLDLGAKVPAVQLGGQLTTPGLFLRSDQTWATPPTLIHAPSHAPAGADEISVTGLHGQLGDLQPVAQHAASHEPGGSDVVIGGVPSPTLPGFYNTEGTLLTAPRLDHNHAASGQVFVNFVRGSLWSPNAVELCPLSVPDGKSAQTLRLRCWGEIHAAVPGHILDIQLHADPVTGQMHFGRVRVPIPGDSVIRPLLIEARLVNDGFYVDGFVRATLGAPRLSSLPASVHVDTYEYPTYNNRLPGDFSVRLGAEIEGFSTDAQFYIHWQTVDLLIH